MKEAEKKYALYIGLVAIAIVICVIIGLYSCDVDANAASDTIATTVETTVETVPETIAETTQPKETIHIEETTIPEIHTEPTVVTRPSSEAPSAPVSGEINISAPQTELEMLACVIYQEAGGDACCDECRYRVADIVLNRIASSGFPNTMYEVLTAESQYGSYHWTGVVWADRANNPGEKHAVERAYKVAEEVLNGRHSELYGNGYVWQAGFEQGSDGFWCCGHFYGR